VGKPQLEFGKRVSNDSTRYGRWLFACPRPAHRDRDCPVHWPWCNGEHQRRGAGRCDTGRPLGDCHGAHRSLKSKVLSRSETERAKCLSRSITLSGSSPDRTLDQGPLPGEVDRGVAGQRLWLTSLAAMQASSTVMARSRSGQPAAALGSFGAKGRYTNLFVSADAPETARRRSQSLRPLLSVSVASARVQRRCPERVSLGRSECPLPAVNDCRPSSSI
jgi:hypothetical protein